MMYFYRPFVDGTDEYWQRQKAFIDWITYDTCFSDMLVLKKCAACKDKVHGTYVRIADSDALPALVCFSASEWASLQSDIRSGQDLVTLVTPQFRVSQNAHLLPGKVVPIESSDDIVGESASSPKNRSSFSFADMFKKLQVSLPTPPGMPPLPAWKFRIPGFSTTNFTPWLPPYWLDFKETTKAIRPSLVRWTVYSKFDDPYENRFISELEKLAFEPKAGINIRFAAEYVHALVFYLSCVSSDLVTPDPDRPVRTLSTLALTKSAEGFTIFNRLIAGYVWKAAGVVHNIVRLRITTEELWQRAVQDELIRVLAALRPTSATREYPWVRLRVVGSSTDAQFVPVTEAPHEVESLFSGGAFDIRRSRTAVGNYFRKSTDLSTDRRELERNPTEMAVVMAGRELKSRFERVTPEVMQKFFANNPGDDKQPPKIFQQDVNFIMSFLRLMTSQSQQTFEDDARKWGIVDLVLRPEKGSYTLTHEQTVFAFQTLVVVTHSTDALARFFDALRASSVRSGIHYAATLCWSVVQQPTIIGANLCNALVPRVDQFVRGRIIEQLQLRMRALRNPETGNRMLSASALARFAGDNQWNPVAIFDEITRLVSANVSGMATPAAAPSVDLLAGGKKSNKGIKKASSGK